MKKSSGMTLVELIVAVGIMSIVSAISIDTIYRYIQDHQTMQKTAGAEVDTTLALRVLWFDLRLASPSMNTLKTKDDNAQDFFDYYGDLPAFSLPAANRTRVITLDPVKRPSIDLVLTKGSQQSMLYNPLNAYNYLANQPDLNVSSPVTYAGLNKGNVARLAFGAEWKEGAAYFMMSPVPLRPVVNNVVDMAAVPHNLIYAGTVSAGGNDLEAIPASTISMVNTHPVFPAVQINSADTFFRWLPPSGGVPVVLLVPIRIVRYLVKVNPKAGFDFYSQELKGRNFTNDLLIARGLKTLRFKRPLISLPTIEVEYEVLK